MTCEQFQAAVRQYVITLATGETALFAPEAVKHKANCATCSEHLSEQVSALHNTSLDSPSTVDCHTARQEVENHYKDKRIEGFEPELPVNVRLHIQSCQSCAIHLSAVIDSALQDGRLPMYDTPPWPGLINGEPAARHRNQ